MVITMLNKRNKWTPSTTAKPRNFIVSSDAVAQGIKSFVPSYETDGCKPTMSDLLTNGYMRQWFVERVEYDRNTYQRGSTKADPKNKKKFIPKPKPKSRVRELPVIQLKQFQNIASRTDSNRRKAIKEDN